MFDPRWLWPAPDLPGETNHELSDMDISQWEHFDRRAYAAGIGAGKRLSVAAIGMPVATVNQLFGLATIVMQILIVVFLGIYFLQSRSQFARDIATSIWRFGLWIGLALAGAGTILAMYYSGVLGFEPCPLCWWQRIFLFPQVILFALALSKREKGIADYSIALSIIGGGIALYHHALQTIGAGVLPCPATGVSCAQRIIFEFGYVTFPLIAASLFALLIVVMLFVRKRA